MSTTSMRKHRPLSMRLPDADIDVIDRAAAMRGRSRTEFVRDAAVRAAEDALMENLPMRMSAVAFEAFMEVIAGPAVAVPEMVEIFRRVPPWER